jgi:hypothetical protein
MPTAGSVRSLKTQTMPLPTGTVVFYCPACAEREFEVATRATSYS